MAKRSFQQTDTAAAEAVAACSGQTLASTPIARLCVENGTAGTTGFSPVIRNARAGVMFELFPGQLLWDAGQWKIRLRVTVTNSNINWTQAYVCRRTSGGSAVETVGSTTGALISMGTTGVKTLNVTGAVSSAGAASDKAYLVLVFTTPGGTEQFTFVPDQLIDTPIQAPIPHETVRIRQPIGPPISPRADELLEGRSILRRGVPANFVPGLFDGRFFQARGYTTGGFSDKRPAALGPFQIDSASPSYTLPNLAHGTGDDLIARGPLISPADWQTIQLGKLRVIDGFPPTPGLLFVRARVAPGQFPPVEELRGRARFRRGVSEDLFPPASWTKRLRIARPPAPFPGWLDGSTRLGRGVPENFTPPTFSPQGMRLARPPRFPVDELRGRARLRRGRSKDIIGPQPFVLMPWRAATSPPPAPGWLRGRVISWGFVLRLVLEPREVSLLADLDILAGPTYRVVARNLATGAETVLGTGTSIDDVAIADGDYALRVEVDAKFWRGARYATEYPLSISGGEIVSPLPCVLNLAAQTIESSVHVTWALEALAGAATPTDFGIWTSATTPVSTAGAPDETAAFGGDAGYLVELAASPSLLYVAVAARSGATVGPVSEVTVAGVETALNAPDGQSARQPDGDWS